MNELFCLNQIYQDLSGVRSILQFIEGDLVILLWIIGITAGIFSLVWLTLGVFSAILLIEIKKKVHAELIEIYSKDMNRKIRKMKRIAKHRIEKGGDIYEENKRS